MRPCWSTLRLVFPSADLNSAGIKKPRLRRRFLSEGDPNGRQMWQRRFLHDGTEDISPSYYLRHREHSSPLSFGASSSWIIESPSCRSPWRTTAIWSFWKNLHSHLWFFLSFSFCRLLTQTLDFWQNTPVSKLMNTIHTNMRWLFLIA